MDDSATLKTIEKSLLAILTLLVEKREIASRDIDGSKNRNVETLLSEVGFKSPEVAKIVNKNLAAVQKAIQRDRKQK